MPPRPRSATPCQPRAVTRVPLRSRGVTPHTPRGCAVPPRACLVPSSPRPHGSAMSPCAPHGPRRHTAPAQRCHTAAAPQPGGLPQRHPHGHAVSPRASAAPLPQCHPASPPPTTHTRARAPGGARRVPARGSAAEDRRSAAPRPSPRPRPRPGPGAHCAPHAGGPRWRRRRRAPRAAPDNRGRRGGVGARALPAFLRPRTATPRRAARPRARPHPAARGRPVAWCGASGCAMGERLELRLKSPVGAEPAVYPWPLPVYVSTGGGAGGALRPFGFTRRFAVSCRRASRCPRVTRLRLVPVCPAASERCPSGAGSASEPRALPGGSPCPGPARCPRCRGSAPRAA